MNHATKTELNPSLLPVAIPIGGIEFGHLCPRPHIAPHGVKGRDGNGLVPFKNGLVEGDAGGCSKISLVEVNVVSFVSAIRK